MRTPRLSICIPTYRQIDYLRETLRSVQAQTFDDYELIISDDTPDDSVSRLVELFNFGYRLRYHRNSKALGSPQNWNEAVRQAKGDYIKLLHHDDRLANPDALGAFVRMLDEHPESNFAFSASLVENVTSKKSRIHCPTAAQLARIAVVPEEVFFGNIIGAPSATIYRNRLGIEYDQRMKWLVDIDFYIRVLQQNPSFIFSQEALVVTTSGANHQITNTSENNAEVEMLEYVILYKKIESKLDKVLCAERVWFRLFEKYRIYSLRDLELLCFNSEFYNDEFLTNFFSLYSGKWLSRLPYRVYTFLPEPIKAVTTYLRNLRNLCRSKN
jgi:glycosyltransferase involved in cell wall biosynthesis